MTPLLVCIVAAVPLLCLALPVVARLCNLEQFEVRANFWKVAGFSLTARSRPPLTKSPPPATRRGRRTKKSRKTKHPRR